MRTNLSVLFLSVSYFLALGQEVRLLSLQQNGSLTWTNAQIGGNYRISQLPGAAQWLEP